MFAPVCELILLQTVSVQPRTQHTPTCRKPECWVVLSYFKNGGQTAEEGGKIFRAIRLWVRGCWRWTEVKIDCRASRKKSLVNRRNEWWKGQRAAGRWERNSRCLCCITTTVSSKNLSICPDRLELHCPSLWNNMGLNERQECSRRFRPDVAHFVLFACQILCDSPSSF